VNSRWRFAAFVAVVCVVLGCEWKGTSDKDAWDDSYSWINFSGTYRAPDGGELVVKQATVTTWYTSSTNSTTLHIVTDYKIGEGDWSATYGGTLPAAFVPLSPGSMKIGAGGLYFIDDGSENLTVSNSSWFGHIEYNTGAWSIDLTGAPLPSGEDILGSWNYYDTNKTSNTGGGAEGDYPFSGIYSVRLEQLGNRMRMVDGKGGTYEGQIMTVTSGTGDKTGLTSGRVELQFEVEGLAHDGRRIKIYGSLFGDYVAPTSDDTERQTQHTGNLGSRTLQAIWVELDNPGLTGDIVGTAGSVEIAIEAFDRSIGADSSSSSGSSSTIN